MSFYVMNDFQQSFGFRLDSKFPMNSSFKIPPYLKLVGTQPLAITLAMTTQPAIQS